MTPCILARIVITRLLSINIALHVSFTVLEKTQEDLEEKCGGIKPNQQVCLIGKRLRMLGVFYLKKQIRFVHGKNAALRYCTRPCDTVGKVEQLSAQT